MRTPAHLTLVAVVSAVFAAAPAMAAEWPSLAEALPPQNVGPNDAAVVIGVGDYAFLPDIGGAAENATDWFLALTKTRGIPSARVRMLRNSEATAENIREATAEATGAVGEGGTLWFIFIGHGAPNEAHDDGILVGSDAQLTEKSLIARGVPQKAVLELLEGGKQAHTVVIFDACFSGSTGDGKTPLVPGSMATVPVKRVAAQVNRATILSSSDQVAGPLPGHDRPAFTYLLLGGLRGWADKDKDRRVSAVEAFEYSRDVLRDLVRNRTQIPSIQGPGDVELAVNAPESGPDLLALRAALAPTQFRGNSLSVPTIDPSTFQGSTLKTLNLPVEQALERAVEAQESTTASSEAKREAWCSLAGMKDNNVYLEKANGLCAQWAQYVDAEKQLESSITSDYDTLVGMMELKLKTSADKLALVDEFMTMYGRYADKEEVKAARLAKQNLEGGKPAGISKDSDGDRLLVDSCPNESEDYDGDTDDDGCPERNAGEVAGEVASGALSGAGDAIDGAGKALGEAGIRFPFLDWSNPSLDTGLGFGLGVFDKTGVPDLGQPTLRPSLSWSNRAEWGLFEVGGNVDWDLARDLEDQAFSLNAYAGARVIGVSIWTPSLGVDYRNIGDWATGRRGGPGVYFGNMFRVVDGFSLRLTYRYGLEQPGGLVPVHSVFLEAFLSVLSPKGSMLGELLDEMDLCN